MATISIRPLCSVTSSTAKTQCWFLKRGWAFLEKITATTVKSFVMGTDGERIQIAAIARRTIIEARAMMPVGFQLQDLEAMRVNDLA